VVVLHKMTTLRKPTFRANEFAASGREWAINFYTRELESAEEKKGAIEFIDKLIEEYGPVVDGYPSWHPFTSMEGEEGYDPQTDPIGFEGLDHTIYFRDAFITAPYGNAKKVSDSVFERNDGYSEDREILDTPLYHRGATPVLVKCVGIPKEKDGTIGKRFAMGRMLSAELSQWETADCGESWETMSRYLLGTPCGSRSSLFVNQDTGKALKEAYQLLNRHGVFGPVR